MGRMRTLINEDAVYGSAHGPLYITLSATAQTIHGVSTTTNYQMLQGDHNIVADTALGDGNAIITLPSVAECIGEFYTIHAPTGATGGDISVYEKETGAEYTDGNLNADADTLMVYSTGYSWISIVTPA